MTIERAGIKNDSEMNLNGQPLNRAFLLTTVYCILSADNQRIR